MDTLYKICRLCPNEANWKFPTKKDRENKKAYTAIYGFGFEEWINREEWVLSGYDGTPDEWRYAHIQGLFTPKNSHVGKKAKILFYVKYSKHDPMAVGLLETVYIIDKYEALWAAKQFANNKWLHTMHGEVNSIGGDVAGLPPIPNKPDEYFWDKSPLWFVNVKYRPSELVFFEDRKRIEVKSQYYNNALTWDGVLPTETTIIPHIKFPLNKKALNRFSEEIRERRSMAGKPFLPRQAPIQNNLSVQLDGYFGPGVVLCEDERVDIKLKAPDHSVTFVEIKPAASAKESIRLAIGQLLEYSHYPNTVKADRFVIVGDAEPKQEDLNYLFHINSIYNTTIRYVFWPRGAKSISDQQLRCFV